MTATVRSVGLVILAIALAPVARAGDLAAQIEAVTGGPDYRHARWGILIVDARTGKAVYEQNADRLFVPASTTKLYTCGAALALLGPDFRFETPVYCRGPVEQGTLKGDLILVASGDLTLGGRNDTDGKMAFADSDHTYADSSSTTAAVTDTDPLAGLKSLAKQVRESGISRVTGEVLIDDRLFELSRSSGSGPGLVTPIVVNDNVVDVLVTPGGSVGQPATVRMRPETAFVQMDARVRTVAAGEKPEIEVTSAGPRRFTVRGKLAVDSPPLTRIYAVEEPSAFARALFIEVLWKEGIDVGASPLRDARAELPDRDGYGRLTRVAAFTSPPLSEVVKVTLKVSHNLYASTLPLVVAARHGGRSLSDGLRRERSFFQELGLDVGAVSFAGGAGGANADSTTPRATVQLLQLLAKRPEYAALEHGMPILGVDGTLSKAVAPDSPARGKVRAKTGTLGWYDTFNDRPLLRSKALAGTMVTAGGRPLVIAVFVNDVPLPHGVDSTREGKVLGHLCEIVYQHADAEPSTP